MKKILLIVMAVAAMFSMVACDDTETYADLVKTERDSISAFLRNEQITVISEKEFKERFNDPAKVQIIEAHQALLEDPELIAASQAGIGRGESAAFAWRAACQSSAAQLEALQGNALLRERANDIRDVGRRVLSLITGIKTEASSVSEGSILIAQELTPSDTASLDPSRFSAFVR